MYHVERHFVETGEPFNGGQHIMFVNGDYTGDGEVAQLVHDMKQSDPDKIQNKALSDRVRIFKETNEEGSKVSELTKKVYDMGRDDGMEEGITQGITQGEDRKAHSTARAMLARRLDIALIADCTGLPQSEVTAMAASAQ